MENMTKYSDELIKKMEKTLAMYNEGAITSPDCCRHLLLLLADNEKQIQDENDLLEKELNRGN